MERCAICKGPLKKYTEVSEGVRIRGWKCQGCSETFFPSSEMLRWEVLTGRRKSLARRVRVVGHSKVVTLPEKLVEEEKIHDKDLVLFEKIRDGLLLKVIHTEL